ncbi:MAG TPA: CDP-alcohol phosphatidyltransferase family protein [Methylomirabilota bacterium]|nr:CDP-alcohol phosphatidyltransferase family protein [Methylomirabilota bacterium]
MIRQAAVYLVSADDVRTARLSVAGRPLVFRAIVGAVRAGITRVLVPLALRSPDLALALESSPRARAAVAWLGAPGALADEPTLVLPVSGLTSPDALRRLLAAPGASLLAESLTADAPCFVADRSLLAAVRPLLVAGAPLGEALDRARKLREVPVVMAGRWYVRVADAATAAEAEARLYATLGSPIDTPLDTHLHRRLSRPLSRLAVGAGIGANAVTLASGVVGLASVAAFARGEAAAVVAGFLLYVVAVVLDHADGEVARLTLTESALGEWLDIIVDTLIHGTMLLALGLACVRVTGAGMTAGVIGAVAVIISGMLGKIWPPAPPAAAGRGLLDRLSSRDGFYGMLLSFVLVRIAAPALLPTLLMVIALGSHVYWVARVAFLLSRKTRRKPK